LKLNAAVSECRKSLETIPTSNEKEFRAEMKKYGPCLAKHQEAIDKILDSLGRVAESCTEEFIASGSQAESYTEAKVAVDMCIEYLSMYVAMTMLQTSKIQDRDKAQVRVLADVVGTLRKAAATAKKPIFLDIAAEMHSLIEGVQLGPAAPSEGGADSEVKGKGKGKGKEEAKGRGKKRKHAPDFST